MATRVRSFAKINLGLAIGLPRADGFHALATVYQTIGLHDLVSLTAEPTSATRIEITSNHADVPLDERNTAWKMVVAALAALGMTARVAIHIEKQLPVQGGLGAGSANAAAALVALERELGARLTRVHLSAEERLRLAAEVGSDVPLFLIGGTVLGLGRGEQVYPLPDLEPEGVGAGVRCVVATPEVGVSTPRAFRDWDALHTEAPGPSFGLSLAAARTAYTSSVSGSGLSSETGSAALTDRDPSARLGMLSRAVAGVWCGPHSSGVSTSRNEGMGDLAGNPLLALVRTGIENDFEEVVFPQHSLLGDIKRTLADSVHPGEQAVYASLSGSGASLFGLYESEVGAAAAQQRLAAMGVSSLRTEMLSRERYWGAMFAD